MNHGTKCTTFILKKQSDISDVNNETSIMLNLVCTVGIFCYESSLRD